MSELLIATDSAVLYCEGEQFIVHKDVTRVASDHPMVKRNPHLFKPCEAHYGVEDTRAHPAVPPARGAGRAKKPSKDE